MNKMIIKNRAKELGFDLIGITTADPFKKIYKILQKRKEKNQLPDFMEKNIKLITHPELVFPGAKSIISVAMSYAVNLPENEDGFISRYTRGRDYHKVFSKKLNLLSEFIKKMDNNIKTRYFCDTGPLLERAIASRAGLGWIGKNTNLINPEYGSYLFLGEILTNLKLKSDSPKFKNKCENCKLCLKNCQGQALKPYYLDHNNCISFLTQKKGILSKKERNIINDCIWGCDQCQEICPYNKQIPRNLHPDFSVKIKANIEEILNLDKNNIPPKWNNTALSWRGLRILKRNTLIVIKNKNLTKYIPLVRDQLSHPSPIIRSYVLWTLFNIDSNFKEKELKKFFQTENNKMVLKEINRLLNNPLS